MRLQVDLLLYWLLHCVAEGGLGPAACLRACDLGVTFTSAPLALSAVEWGMSAADPTGLLEAAAQTKSV